MALTPQKRVWKTTSVRAEEGGYAVFLDHRALRTPGKAALIVPSLGLAEAIAAEWEAVETKINPSAMPLTRAANTVIDKLARSRQAVIDMLVEYGGTDLLCYRADEPAELVDRQAQKWGPILDWATQDLNAPLVVYTGIMPQPQPDESLAKLMQAIAQFDDYSLAGLHDLITISGSILLGLAVAHGRILPEDGFELSRLDAEWQAALWGRDDEADALAAAHRRDFLAAARLLKLLNV